MNESAPGTPAPGDGERLLALGDDRFWIAVAGTGECLLMLHGGPGAEDAFGALAPALQDYARCVRFEQRGCGRTRAAERFDLATALHDIEAIRVALGVRRWMVLGHSFGCELAALYAHAHPARVAALLLISAYQLFGDERPAYRSERDRRLGDRRGRYEALQAELAQRWEAGTAAELWSLQAAVDLHPASAPALFPRPASAIAWAANAALGAAASQRLSEPAVQSALRASRVPTLVLHGSGDARPGTAALTWVAAAPWRRLAAIDLAGHWPWLERPRETIAALTSFLAALPELGIAAA